MGTQCSLSWDSMRAIQWPVQAHRRDNKKLNGMTVQADIEERCVFETRTTEA